MEGSALAPIMAGKGGVIMQEKEKSKSPSPNDNKANVKNPNNPQLDQANGNKGKQLNPNQKEK